MANYKEKTGSFLVKVILSLGVVILIFIAAAIYREVAKKNEIQDKISQLQQEAEQISRSNALTQDRIAYLESKDYQEREAKDKLNLQSPDEQTVIIQPTVANKKSEVKTENIPDVPIATPPTPNVYKWWDYFFKY